ncbi:protein far1-related sequence 9 [Fagus crenata]
MTTCSCKHFEFWGILCRHILSVFLHKDCYRIPPMYLLSRWCREASLMGKELLVLDGEDLVDKEIDVIDEDCFVHCPPISKTKGRPKQKRMKGGRELGKQKKTCRLRKHIGHNISTCPEKNNSTSSSNGTNRRKKMTSVDIGLNPVLYLKC